LFVDRSVRINDYRRLVTARAVNGGHYEQQRYTKYKEGEKDGDNPPCFYRIGTFCAKCPSAEMWSAMLSAIKLSTPSARADSLTVTTFALQSLLR
jgi:hypothetical protein